MFRSSCIVCGASELNTIVNLGMHPFADTFIAESRLSAPDLTYPLACDLCNECGQIQAKCITDPIDRYSKYDYSFTSSNSAFSRKHWKDYALEVSREVNLHKNAFIVEIGSNDGYLCEQFMASGHRAIGVDVSPCMAGLAKERNVDTIVGLFDSKIAKKISSEYGRPELVVANNVYNHVDLPVDFAHCVAGLLAPKGTFVIEVPYWCISLQDGRFDQIYHEHVSYFTVRSLVKIFEMVGMAIDSIELVDYHGGSLRVFVKRREDISHPSLDAQRMIEKECSSGVFEIETYSTFMNKILAQRSRFLERVYRIKREGGPIVAVGAAAKGNTFLNFYNLDHSIIDYVTDVSIYKKGKYTPRTRIPICGDEIFAEYDGVYALILSSNIPDKLKRVLLEINPKIRFLTP